MMLSELVGGYSAKASTMGQCCYDGEAWICVDDDGTYIVTDTSVQFLPQSGKQYHVAGPAISIADQQLMSQRLVTCKSCNSWKNERCSIAGCSCNGMGQPNRRLSKCPLGQWKE